MELSIIIVNYNVKYFLEQALLSVRKALTDISGEVFVVDNCSVDGSAEMVREKFPEVNLIVNSVNGGFAKANNQAIRIATGKYILLLNPDTIVEEDTFRKILDFMEQPENQNVGGLGVKMMDGSGKFLPESKRSLPTPFIAFCKISGLSSLFPKSKIFGRYHLGFLDINKTHDIEVLSGAFMFLRSSALEKSGLLDEHFFMYGEDIDLSFRILQAGYRNIYFPETRIIHYKGESTRKTSVNYVLVFYQAMIIFAKKHFSGKNAKTLIFLINIAIYLRAGLAISRRFFNKAILPILDFGMIWGGMYLLKGYWQDHIRDEQGVHYPEIYMLLVVPIYIIIWLTSVYLSGGYDKPVKLTKVIRGIFSATILILVIYALLPEDFRFSRGLILLGTFWASLSMITLRLLLNLFKLKEFLLESNQKKRMLIIGDPTEGKRVLSLLNLAQANLTFIGFVLPSEIEEDFTRKNETIENNKKEIVGTSDQITELVEVYKIREIIFCAKNISSQQIITLMSKISRFEVIYKTAPPESLYVIGSNAAEYPGELYLVNMNAISNTPNKRSKRVFDILTALSCLIISPILIFGVRQPLGLYRNIFLVLSGKLSWVGFCKDETGNPEVLNITLPKIKKGVLTPSDATNVPLPNLSTKSNLNILYARDYSIYYDFNIFKRSIRSLGRKV